MTMKNLKNEELIMLALMHLLVIQVPKSLHQAEQINDILDEIQERLNRRPAAW